MLGGRLNCPFVSPALESQRVRAGRRLGTSHFPVISVLNVITIWRMRNLSGYIPMYCVAALNDCMRFKLSYERYYSATNCLEPVSHYIVSAAC